VTTLIYRDGFLKVAGYLLRIVIYPCANQFLERGRGKVVFQRDFGKAIIPGNVVLDILYKNITLYIYKNICSILGTCSG
jgi:hypothetical protein